MPKYHHRPIRHRNRPEVFLKPAEVQEAEDDGGDIDAAFIRTHSRRGKLKHGLWSGAPIVPGPRVFRRFGSNTRERVYRLPDTGILDNVYDPKIFESGQGNASCCSALFGSSTLGQAGCPSILQKCPALHHGSGHMLFAKKS